MPRTLYFISHPEVDIRPDVPVPEWSLSSKGLQRMSQSLTLPWINDVTAVYSSTEKKAIDGANILSAHLGLQTKTIHALGENDRSSTGYLAADEFEVMADSFFASPENSIRGWEKAVDAQLRISQAVAAIDNTDTSSGSIAIVSHGAVGTLLYCYMTNTAIDRQFDQPGSGGGNYLVLTYSPEKHCDWWKPIA